MVLICTFLLGTSRQNLGGTFCSWWIVTQELSRPHYHIINNIYFIRNMALTWYYVWTWYFNCDCSNSLTFKDHWRTVPFDADCTLNKTEHSFSNWCLIERIPILDLELSYEFPWFCACCWSVWAKLSLTISIHFPISPASAINSFQ